MKKLLCAIITASMLLCSIGVSADVSALDISRDGDYVVINGNADRNVTVTVLKKGAVTTSIDVENIFCIAKVKINKGEFEYRWLPVKNGEYDIYVSDSLETEVVEGYIYFTTDTKDKVMEILKEGTLSELEEALCDRVNIVVLENTGVISAADLDLYDSVVDAEDEGGKLIAKSFYNIRESLTDSQKENVQNYLPIAMYIAKAESEDEVYIKEIISELDKLYSGFANGSFYTKYRSDKLDAEIERLTAGKKSDMDLKALTDAVNDAIVIAGVNTESLWSGINKYVKLLKYSKYNNAKNRDDIDELLHTNVQTAYYQSVQAIKDVIDENAVSGPSGGGGGGGGGVSTGWGASSAADSVYVEEVEDTSGDGVPDIAFDDVAETDWYFEAVNYLKWNSIVQGNLNYFYPNDNITRAELVTMLNNAFGISGDEYTTASFDDVSADAWYYDVVVKAAGAGLVLGDGTNFNPNTYVTRQDAAVMVYRFISKAGIKMSSEDMSFDDAASISDYAKDAVAALSGNGIINGMGNNCFEPANTTTRAQVAQIIYKIVK